jgi:DNA helicase II / ATP-dependent DNA helicase PcrA
MLKMGRTQIARLVGGAGTGKTTELLQVMEKAKAGLGGSPFALGFASFTRAARAEAASRAASAWGVPEDVLQKDGWFRTAHSVAYRQLAVKNGQMLSRSKESQRWLADALGVSVHVMLDDDSGMARYSGDQHTVKAIQAWELSRARCEPLRKTVEYLVRSGQEPPAWGSVCQIVNRYEKAKRRDERYDFSDLLSKFAGIRFTVDGVDNVEPEGECPPSVKAWIFDEAQDSSSLVHKVCQRLANNDIVQWCYIAGDPFQSIFSFGGSDSSHFMNWKADKERIMPQSWRCPKAVLELGERCLRGMKDGYWDRKIAAASHEGVIKQDGGFEHALSKLTPETDALIIARCKYTLRDYTETLTRKGLPHRMINETGDTKIVRGYKAFWDLEHGEPVSGEDLACAIEATPTRSLSGALMKRGVKASWTKDDTMAKDWDMILPSDLKQIGFEDALVNQITEGRWAGLMHNAEKWRKSAVKFGAELATQPHIRVGTIHSTKGMEAETVVLSTAISRRVKESQERDPRQYDEERRVEYVGVTRAKKNLIIANDDSENSMRLPL